MPHMDTVDRVMRHLKTEQIERLKQRMVQTIIPQQIQTRNQSIHIPN